MYKRQALALHIPLAEIAAALRTAQSVQGRVEVVPTPGKDDTFLLYTSTSKGNYGSEMPYTYEKYYDASDGCSLVTTCLLYTSRCV